MNKEYLESIGVILNTSNEFPGLTLLNYSQIETPKNIKDAYACRGHIVDESGNYMCRPFDRFFNFGEHGTGDNVDWSTVKVIEKLDGSLIKVWFDGRNWQIGTRGTFSARTAMPATDTTFRDYTIKTFGLEGEQDWQDWARKTFDPSLTYLLELTSPYNRVVVPHTTNNLWLLAVRNNHSGYYWSFDEKDTVIKKELYDAFLKSKNIIAVFDDRPSVVDMWNDLGLSVFAVADQRNKF